MHIKPLWSYINKGLLTILSFLVVSTLLSLVYLAYTLKGAHQFNTQGSSAVSTAFVLQDLIINIQQIESGARGYALTGDAAFLDPYNTSLKNIPADLHSIQGDTKLHITASQKRNLTELTNKKVDFSKQVVAARTNEGFETAASLIQTHQGEQIMSALQGQVNNISSLGLHNIGPMRGRSEANLRRALLVTGALALLILGTCMAVIWYFQRTILRERALDSTKNEFLSLASHQLRTPATNVKQYLGLLLDGYMGTVTEQQRHALQIAYKNNESEITIMNNLLEVAKLDLERIQLHKKVVNISAIVRHVVQDHAAKAKEREQSITLEAPKQVMAAVDESYIKGVLDNLVDNALKYSRDGTHIRLEVSREQDYVYVRVKDQGLGIKKRDIGKLFNKFSRLDNEFSANSQGSGLGLYWVKQVVKLHGGSIDVTSKEGKGSVFTVRLPVR